MNKKFITAQDLLEDSFRLAAQVFEDGFRPQFIIGIWRGGAPVGRRPRAGGPPSAPRSRAVSARQRSGSR